VRRTAGFVLAALLPLSGCAWIERASVPTGDPESDANAPATALAISDNGRFVAFVSAATNLVSGDDNGVADVFVRDLVADTTDRVSVASDGGEANGASTDVSISDDGQRVAFATSAANLDDDDNDAASDVFVHDRTAHTTTLVSTGYDPLPPPVTADPESASASGPTISGDGDTVAFNLTVPVFGTTVGIGPFVHRASDTTVRRLTHGALFPGRPSLSDDGSRIAYTSISPSASGIDGDYSAIVVDVATDSVVAVVDAGFASHQSQLGFGVTLSGDGATAGYVRTSSSPATNTVFRYRIVDATLDPIVVGIFGLRSVSISDDGDRLAYLAAVAGTGELYVVDPSDPLGPRLVSTDTLFEPASYVGDGVISGDGNWVGFTTVDATLVPSDDNGVDDVFVRSVDPRDSGPR
jgi:Tol biopolymer transport system component